MNTTRRLFWKTIKSATAQVSVQSSITQEEWLSHFSTESGCDSDSDGVADSERLDAIEGVGF